jgi:hypothetical protein
METKAERLRCYTVDDVDTFVARDLSDLWVQYERHYGEDYEAIVGDPRSDALVVELRPDLRLTIIDDVHEDPDKKTTRTVAEWIETNGPGLLCSTEW